MQWQKTMYSFICVSVHRIVDEVCVPYAINKYARKYFDTDNLVIDLKISYLKKDVSVIHFPT